MAVKLIKSSAANAYRGYRPHWYGVYRDGDLMRTFNLGVLVRGEPPASGLLTDAGDKTFEASREKAKAKFDNTKEQIADKGEAIRECKTIVRIKTGRKFKDPSLASLEDAYLKRLGQRTTKDKAAILTNPNTKRLGKIAEKNIGGRSPCHLAMIRSCFQHFAAFAANPDDPEVNRARTMLEVTPELAAAFFRHIAADFAFSTVKKWSTVLTGAFDRLAPSGTINPFKGTRLDALGRAQAYRDEETGEKVKVEKVVHHLPIDRDQLRKLYRTAKDDDFLYPLTVTAASTGLRIADVCTLQWKDIHLTAKNPIVMVEATAKTGATIAVPILDYDPTSPDYEPDLGEFRRVLEAALADAQDGEKYVFPEAAHLYLKTAKDEKTGKIRYPGRDVIYSRGKALFARALFADGPEDAELATAPETTDEDVIAAINGTNWTDNWKRIHIDIYQRRKNGATYREITTATGYTKATISTYLANIEAISGAKLRTYSIPQKPSLRALLQKTRQARNAGRRDASLYSWHSLRGSFVVMMNDYGLPLDTIRLLVGHTTTDMTLEYYNPTPKIAAENTRAIMTRRNRAQGALEAPQTRRAVATPQLSVSPADAPHANLDALREALAKLTPEERAQLLNQTK